MKGYAFMKKRKIGRALVYRGMRIKDCMIYDRGMDGSRK